MKLIQFFYSDIIHKYFSLYKIYLYLLVSILCISFILNFVLVKEDIYEKKIFLQEKQKNSLNNKNKKLISVILLEDIENYLKLNNLNALSLKLMKNSISLQLEGSYENSLKLINFIENYSGYLLINKITLINNYLKMSTNLTLNIIISDKFIKYNKINTLKIIQNNFINKKENISIEKNILTHKELNLSAIVDKKVLINDKWYEENDLIYNNKIIKIKEDFITLKKGSKIFYLRLYENEFIR